MSEGHPAAARSMNFEGLRRRGFGTSRIAAVKAMHKALYRDNLTVAQAAARIAELPQRFEGCGADVGLMQDFLAGLTAQRGIVR
jgi:UDP-N-acetylglucosamine acyltransferase